MEKLKDPTMLELRQVWLANLNISGYNSPRTIGYELFLSKRILSLHVRSWRFSTAGIVSLDLMRINDLEQSEKTLSTAYQATRLKDANNLEWHHWLFSTRIVSDHFDFE